MEPTCMHSPVDVLHTLMQPSAEPEHRVSPMGLNSMQRTLLLCPLRSWHLPLIPDHRAMLPDRFAVAMWDPSRSTDTTGAASSSRDALIMRFTSILLLLLLLLLLLELQSPVAP